MGLKSRRDLEVDVRVLVDVGAQDNFVVVVWMRLIREDEGVTGLRANLYSLAAVVICLARSSKHQLVSLWKKEKG